MLRQEDKRVHSCRLPSRRCLRWRCSFLLLNMLLLLLLLFRGRRRRGRCDRCVYMWRHVWQYWPRRLRDWLHHRRRRHRCLACDRSHALTVRLRRDNHGRTLLVRHLLRLWRWWRCHVCWMICVWMLLPSLRCVLWWWAGMMCIVPRWVLVARVWMVNRRLWLRRVMICVVLLLPPLMWMDGEGWRYLRLAWSGRHVVHFHAGGGAGAPDRRLRSLRPAQPSAERERSRRRLEYLEMLCSTALISVMMLS